MLTAFILRHRGLIDEITRASLYLRAAGVLVRKGNLKQIGSLMDLAKKAVHLLDVNGAGQLGLWEDMVGPQGLIPKIQKNIAISVLTSAEAIDNWKSLPKLDA
jgi:accessory colonization factor AcfC